MNTTTGTEGTASKWADRVRLIDPATGEVTEASGDILGPPPERFCVQDLPKTAEETAAIGEVIDALNSFLGSCCGLPPARIDPESIHILTQEEFRGSVGGAQSGRFQGKAWFGHVYLWRGWPLWMFQAILAHELFHHVSYSWFDIRTGPETTAAGLRLPRFLPRRMGLILIDPDYGTMLPHFHGLNEGATETAAIAIRQIIARDSKLLDDEDRRSLKSFTISPPLLTFTDQVIMSAVGDGGVVETVRLLFRDCLLGTDDFLGRLEARLPGATNILRRTGARPEELLPSALELGFGAVAKSILPYVAVPQ